MVIIKSSHIQFKNPQVGQPTRAVKEHYNGRRVMAFVNGEEVFYRFKKDEADFDITEEELELLVLSKYEESNK